MTDQGDLTGASGPATERSKVLAAAAAVVVVLLLVAGFVVVRSLGGDDAVAVDATCVDATGDVDLDGPTTGAQVDAYDIDRVRLFRDGDELVAEITLADTVRGEVDANQSQTYEVLFWDSNGDQLYDLRMRAENSALGSHDLRAELVAFDDRANIDDLGFTNGATVPGAANGEADGAAVTLQVDESELRSLPEEFYWTASAGWSLIGTGENSFAFDDCPRTWTEDDEDRPAAEFAAASEGTTTGADVGDSARHPAPPTTRTPPTTHAPPPTTAVTESTNAVTGEPCEGVSGCAYDNGIDFADLRRNIAAALVAEHGAVDPTVDCDRPNDAPPNRIAPGEVIICEAADSTGSSGTVEVTPEGFGQYDIADIDWAG